MRHVPLFPLIGSSTRLGQVTSVRLVIFALLVLTVVAGCASTPSQSADASAASDSESQPQPPDPRALAARDAALERLPLSSCSTSETLLCGSYSVWEDRQAQAGRKIDLNIVVLPALSPDPEPDPIFLFAGGPGGAVAEGATKGTDPGDFDGLREKRDIVLVDQRGTGGSHPLRCQMVDPTDLQAVLSDFLPSEAVESCRAELEKTSDLTLYTTSIAMDDIDEVRAWLGYETINLMGGSYGSRAAQVYLRRHPETVRSAVLQGTVGMDQHLPLYHARDHKRSMDMLIEACERDSDCNATFPEFRSDFEAVLSRLEKAPVKVTVKHPATGVTSEVEVHRQPFGELLRTQLYQPLFAADIPIIIQAAAAGDFEPFVLATLPWQMQVVQSLYLGMFLSVTCAEDLPFVTADEAIRETEGTYLGDFRIRNQKRACDLWPRGEAASGFHEPIESSIPTLLVSGDFDPVTPPSWGEAAGRHLPNSLHVLIPEGHHGILGLTNNECLNSITLRFVETATVGGLETSCVETMRRPPFTSDLDDTVYARMGRGENPFN